MDADKTMATTSAPAQYRGAGTYSIRWECDGKRRTVKRWANNREELQRIVAAYLAGRKGLRVLSIQFRGA